MKNDHVSYKQLTLVECDPPQANKSPGGHSAFACVLSGLVYTLKQTKFLVANLE